MDVYCPRCSEPWDIDTFHDAAAEQESTFDAVRKNFARNGCSALGEPVCERDNSLRSLAAETMFDLLGDDIDGVASLLDDFEYLGMLD